MPRRRHFGGEGVVRPGLGGPLGGGGRAGMLDWGKERAVARGTVVAVGGSAMGATASSLASCRGQGCSNSGSSARRRGETRIGLGEDEDGLSSYGATAQRTARRRCAAACHAEGHRGRVSPGRGARGKRVGRKLGVRGWFGSWRGAWPARGRGAVPDVRRRTDAVMAKNRGGREMEMVVMAVL